MVRRRGSHPRRGTDRRGHDAPATERYVPALRTRSLGWWPVSEVPKSIEELDDLISSTSSYQRLLDEPAAKPERARAHAAWLRDHTPIAVFPPEAGHSPGGTVLVFGFPH